MKPSCQSLTSQLVNVIGNYLDDYQEFRKKAAKAILATAPGSPDVNKALSGLVDEAVDLQTRLFKSYGVVVGQGKGKVGARHLIIPTKKVTGDLKIERTFIVAPSVFDKVIVTIKKTGGKGGADIAVCAKYPNGSHFNEKRKSLDKGKDAKGDSKRFVFADMVEKTLTIHLVKTGFPTDTCDYTVSLEGEFNEEDLRNSGTGRKKVAISRA